MMLEYPYRSAPVNDIDAAYSDLLAAIFIQAAKDLTRLYIKADRIRKKKEEPYQYDLARVVHSIRYNEDWIMETLPQWLDLDPEIIINRCRAIAAQSASK